MEELQLKHKSLKQDLQRLLDEKEDIVREKEEMNIKVKIDLEKATIMTSCVFGRPLFPPTTQNPYNYSVPGQQH